MGQGRWEKGRGEVAEGEGVARFKRQKTRGPDGGMGMGRGDLDRVIHFRALVQRCKQLQHSLIRTAPRRRAPRTETCTHWTPCRGPGERGPLLERRDSVRTLPPADGPSPGTFASPARTLPPADGPSPGTFASQDFLQVFRLAFRGNFAETLAFSAAAREVWRTVAEAVARPRESIQTSVRPTRKEVPGNSWGSTQADYSSKGVNLPRGESQHLSTRDSTWRASGPRELAAALASRGPEAVPPSCSALKTPGGGFARVRPRTPARAFAATGVWGRLMSARAEGCFL